MKISGAWKLLSSIKEVAKHLQLEIHRIGNGEYIIMLAAIEYFIWKLSDWNDYMNSYISAD